MDQPVERVFGYIRLSKWDDRTTSPDRQREAIKRLCDSRGWKLAKVFEDIDVSAYNGKRRAGLQKMLARLSEVDGIVYMRLDRLARSAMDYFRIKQLCQQAGVLLVSTDQPELDTSTPTGKAFEGVSAIFAQLESDTISKRAKDMHAKKRERGEWVGRVPLGWQVVDGKLVPEPKELERLAQAARRYIAGESLRSIARDVGIYHPNLARMLRSDRVIDALPPEVAGALVKNLRERGREGTRAKQSLLGGIARCAVCGGGLTIVGRRKENGDRVPWSAYACRESGHVSISRPWLEDYVSSKVLAWIDTGAIVKWMEQRKRAPGSLESSEIEARLEILDRDYYELGRMPEERHARLREGLLRRLKQARNREDDAGIDLPRELIANLGERWDGLTIMEQRRIISACVERIEISKAESQGRINPRRVNIVYRAMAPEKRREKKARVAEVAEVATRREE